MFQVPLATSCTIVPLENFWESILLYHDRPHLINRKLAAANQILFCKLNIDLDICKINEIFTREALLYEINKLKVLSNFSTDCIKSIVQTYYKNIEIVKSNWDDFKNNNESTFISIRLLFPRTQGEKCLEIVILNKLKKTVTFYAIQDRTSKLIAPDFPYNIELTSSGYLRIILNSFDDAETKSSDWLADKLFIKLLKWAENLNLNTNPILKSLSQIDTEKYCELYNQLKNKYAEDLVKKWPEKANTDPKKFVFEDLAIATYLICLWNKLGVSKTINFVDCGCGNGLLVYILNQEGFKGYGIDLRARKIWDLFNNQSQLKIQTITPDSTFPESNWLIGNHSDELTPWLPVMALRGSPKTNFFVLPCCSYDFNGRKYIRQNTGISQYEDYLNYIKTISIRCGFETEIDKLRIPSTKRTCLVGIRVKFNVDDIIQDINGFVEGKLLENFRPRTEERVRNCTQLKKDLIERIIDLVVKKILETRICVKNYKDEDWNKGGVVSLADLSRIVPQADLKLLKNECGGLQTLLKNHRYLFVVEKGNVSLREPLILDLDSVKYRSKPCWFFKNHPNGCLYDSLNCAYRH